MSQVGIFMSFDLEHDADLTARLVEESERPGSGFRISARSQPGTEPEDDSGAVRRRIRAADEVVVICGERTEGSAQVSAEVRIAREEDTPYILLWGRPDVMCTKPSGAKSSDGIYKWTAEILRDQIATTLRRSQPPQVPDRFKKPEASR